MASYLEEYNSDPFPTIGHTIETPENETNLMETLFQNLRKEVHLSKQFPSQYNLVTFFKKLNLFLIGETSSLRHKATLLASELLPKLDTEIDDCMYLILPSVISNLGNEDRVVRIASGDLIQLYLSQTVEKNAFLENFVHHGLNHKDLKVKKEIIESIPLVLGELYAHFDLFSVVGRLMEMLDEDKLQLGSWRALKHIKHLVGPQEFKRHEMRLSPKSKAKLRRRMPNDLVLEDSDEDDDVVVVRIQPNTPNGVDGDVEDGDGDNDMAFGAVPETTLQKIIDLDNHHLRLEGCQELLNLLEKPSSFNKILPNLPNILPLLDCLRNDTNFRLSTTNLRVLSIVLTKSAPKDLIPLLCPIVASILWHFSDSRFVVRSEAARVFKDLVKKVPPIEVVPFLLEYLTHLSSYVRENCLNILIATMLTFPSAAFDLSYLCSNVTPTLLDLKKRVRQAALEVVAILAQMLSPERINILLDNVIAIENETNNAAGVTSAVQARLAKKTLPRLTSDGLIEFSYTTQGASRKGFVGISLQGPDIDWILAASGSLSIGSVCGMISAQNYLPSLSESTSSADFDSKALSSSLPQPLALPSITSREDFASNRKRSYSEVKLNTSFEEDRNPLAIWSTDPIDLSRTVPAELGNYRGVYLGKLRQGSAIGRAISVEKGYSLHPNIYSSRGIGSARANERGGLSSPRLSSPNPRKLHALEPIDQADAQIVNNPSQQLTKMPPLSARTNSGATVRRISTSGKQIPLEEKEEELNTIEGYFLKNGQPLEEEEEEEESHLEEINEEAEDVKVENGNEGGQSGSAGTRDSGISMLSSHQENDALSQQIQSLSIKKKPHRSGRNGLSREVVDVKRREADSSGEEKVTTDEDDSGDAPESKSPNGRNSYHAPYRGGLYPRLRKTSTDSLPSVALHKPKFKINGKGLSKPFQTTYKESKVASVQKKVKNVDFKNFEYESDFESDEETPRKSRRSIKFNPSTKDQRRPAATTTTGNTQEERLRKYKELQNRHFSGSSLPVTAPNTIAALSRPIGLSRIPKRADVKNQQRTPAKITISKPPLVAAERPVASSGGDPLEFPDSAIGSACFRKNKPSHASRNKPFKNPQNTFQETLRLLKTSDWEEQVDGLQNVSILSATQPRILIPQLKELNSLLLRHAKDLRSQVSRAALQAIMNLFDDLKRDMEQDLDKVVCHLLQRTSDTNRFLQEDSNQALDAMIENLSLSKTLAVVIQEGLGHRSPGVRATTARLIAYAIERTGSDKFLSQQKDVCDRAFPALAKLAQDGSLETRKFAKMAFQRLGKHPNFDAILKKSISSEEQKNIQKFLDNLYDIRGIRDNARNRGAKGGRFRRKM